MSNNLNIYLTYLGGYIYEAHFDCHDILILGKSPIKWRQRPDMTIAVDWDVKHQLKQIQTNEIVPTFLFTILLQEYDDNTESVC